MLYDRKTTYNKRKRPWPISRESPGIRTGYTAFSAWCLLTWRLIAGERYDIVLEANNTAGTYAIHVKGLATCVKDQVYQLGVLQYGNTVTTQNAVPHNPGYNGFALPADYRVSYNTLRVAHDQTPVTCISPPPPA
jgi:hypothetical protein